jgi:uncharacterized protein involved in exopolysaccharide biosynthesis
MLTHETRRADEIRIPPVGEPLVTEGQIVLFEQWSLLRRTWPWVLATAIVAAVVATAYAMIAIPKEYAATVTVVPPNKSSSPLDNLLGGISSSLKDFGLSRLVGGKSGESGYSRIAILHSRSVVDSLIAKYDLWESYEIPRSRPDLLQSAVRSNIEIEVSLEGPVALSVYDTDPKRALAMARDIIVFADAISRDLNRRETEPISQMLGSRYNQVRDEQERIAGELKSFLQKNRIFDVEKQPALIGSALFDAEAQVRTQRIMAESLEKILGPSDARVIQARGVLRELESEVRRLAAGKGTISGLDLDKAPSAAVEGARLQAAYEINTRTLALLQPMYEQSVLDQNRVIPAFQVLDEAQLPLQKARPRYSLIAVGTFVGAFAVCYVLIALLTFLRSFSARYRSYAARDPFGNGVASN